MKSTEGMNEMDGIEALRQLKRGKTLIKFRNEDRKPDRTDYYYRLDFKYEFDEMESSKKIWTRARYEKYWHECENTIKFWLFADNFEIVEENHVP